MSIQSSVLPTTTTALHRQTRLSHVFFWNKVNNQDAVAPSPLTTATQFREFWRKMSVVLSPPRTRRHLSTPYVLFFHLSKEVPHYACCQSFSDHLPFWHAKQHLFPPYPSFPAGMCCCMLPLRVPWTFQTALHPNLPCILLALSSPRHDPANETLSP